MELLKEGKYQGARIVDHKLIPLQGKPPMACVTFQVVDPDGKAHKVDWTGTFNEGIAREITVETLVRMGFKGANGTELDRSPTDGGMADRPLMFDGDKEFTIVVAHNSYVRKNGPNAGQSVTTAKVKSVYDNSGDKFAAESVQAVKGMNLQGDFLAARQKAGVKQPTIAGSFDKNEEVPF